MNYKDEFLKYLTYEKRYSSYTIQAYSTDINQFFNFCNKQYSINHEIEVNLIHIRSWINNMYETKKTAKTIARKISSIKSFYGYLVKYKRYIKNPVEGIILPKQSEKLPVFYKQSEMEKLFSIVAFNENDIFDLRNKTILYILYTTGMRRSELINLKINDYNITDCTLKVLGKGNKHRIIPLLTKCSNLLNKYVDGIQKEISLVHDYMFFTNKYAPLYAKFVYRLVNNYLAKITLQTKCSPHVLRHSFATHMLNNGADLNAIKEILGHASLAATQVYTHNTIENLKTVYNNAHPRA